MTAIQRVRRGFTMIELLMVLAIIAVLSSMLLPVVSLARKKAAETNTMALMRKVETGLELFKGEFATYPYQKHDTAQSFPEADNRLAKILAKDLTVDERNDLDADLRAVVQAYAPGGAHRIENGWDAKGRPWVLGDLDPEIYVGLRPNHLMLHSDLASRGARERGVLAVLAGNVNVMGVHPNRTLPLLANPQSQGAAYDFLSLDLNPSDVQGDAIVDFWGRPLIYNCPVIQGLLPFYPNTPQFGGGDGGMHYINPEFYGFATVTRAETSTLAGDQRTTAAAAFVDSFELWSVGPDGLADPDRTARANRDNLSPTEYWKGLE